MDHGFVRRKQTSASKNIRRRHREWIVCHGCLNEMVRKRGFEPEGRARSAKTERLKLAYAPERARANDGAEERIRTSTGLLQLAPEASASAVPPLPQVVRETSQAETSV